MFRKIDDKGPGRAICYWEAVRAKRIRVPGTAMAAGKGLPHDLVQYVVEAASGIDNGFWGCVAKGATFRSTGRRRTKPGRAVIHQRRDDLDASEKVANDQYAAWQRGERTAVAGLLDAALAQWRELGPDDALVFAWPSPRGDIRSASAGGPLRGNQLRL